MKLTPWYPPEIKPKRKGVYQLGFSFDGEEIHRYAVPYKYWNGRYWSGTTSSDPQNVGRGDSRVSMYDDSYWRGLSSPDAASSLLSKEKP